MLKWLVRKECVGFLWEVWKKSGQSDTEMCGASWKFVYIGPLFLFILCGACKMGHCSNSWCRVQLWELVRCNVTLTGPRVYDLFSTDYTGTWHSHLNISAIVTNQFLSASGEFGQAIKWSTCIWKFPFRSLDKSQAVLSTSLFCAFPQFLHDR